MALLTIRTYPDPVLKKKAEPVRPGEPDVARVLADMAETMYAGNGVGLAGPQVGVSKRLVVIDVPETDGVQGSGLMYLVNPRIVARSGQSPFVEGCLSFPGLEIEVKRATTVTVEFEDETGQTRTREATGLLAVCIQHEIDHLDGILFVDRVGPVRRRLSLHEYNRSRSRASKNKDAEA